MNEMGRWIASIGRGLSHQPPLSSGILIIALSLGGCASTPQPPPAPPRQQPSAASQSSGEIVGALERTPQEKQHLRIWGQVERIRQGAHTTLPPLTATPTDDTGDPVTEIRNQTRATLTIWFAGKCSHQVEVPSDSTVTAVFCPGEYNLAAMVDDDAFLPLVREKQQFQSGLRYRLDFFVKKSPTSSRRR